MAELITAGGWSAERYPVEGDPDKGGLFTKRWLRVLLNAPLDSPPGAIVGHHVRDQHSGALLGTLFYELTTLAYPAGEKPNFQASALIGNLIYGAALFIPRGEPVDW